MQRETNDLLLRIYLREENPEVVNGQHNLALFLLEQVGNIYMLLSLGYHKEYRDSWMKLKSSSARYL